MPLDYTSNRDRVRLLINDDGDGGNVFPDAAIDAFLSMEGDNVKRAAAQALDTIADDEALTSKVIRSQDLSTDGASLAAGLRARAQELRRQAGGDPSGNLAPSGSFPDAAVFPETGQVWPYSALIL
jgi:hypothetical protein